VEQAVAVGGWDGCHYDFPVIVSIANVAKVVADGHGFDLFGPSLMVMSAEMVSWSVTPTATLQ
jgi:hypothetical protein